MPASPTLPNLTDNATAPASASVAARMLEAKQCEARKDLARALLCYMDVLAQEPRHIEAWCAVGHIMVLSQDWQKAIPALEIALQLRPGQPHARRLMALAMLQVGRADEARAMIEEAARSGGDASVWVLRASILGTIDRDPARTRVVFEDWGRRFADPLTRKSKPFSRAGQDPLRRLRIGYVTADFRQHSVAFFMRPVLQHHDPAQVEVHVYSSGPTDAVTAQLQALVPHWHDVRELDDAALYHKIRADRVDVLIDLSGHTTGNRLMVFAGRAAPVQVTWLGFMQTLGMQAMDWRLTDWGATPAGHEAFYTEKLFRLACLASYCPPPDVPLRARPPMLDNGFPTLISLNNSVKVTDAMLRVWARVLAARPDAQLVLMVKETNDEAARAVMQPRIEAAGLPSERVAVLSQLPLADFMKLAAFADIAVDTAPLSGGTTTMHALWMGLPVVALNAVRAIDAASARTLQGIGLGRWVAADEDAYVALALDLLADADRLERERGAARAALQASVLMDYRARTTELEQALRLMWANHVGGHAPRAMDLGWDVARAMAKA
ncbi:tetratricopeptide repeat protein [Pseudorhodoferax soli]|uniref:protein O-GlcNAc transferase n=1 Tax=Pseudorhodoferax soli TaxID=545864 RepID=A0A368XHX1_9BURK|nr:tetratricopeptide repeat protein [Pseudorhodoferax soli]RCW67602.1 putative O-linked N-acetylglucosamine transferase (SPINDLY family) [Pseudorhodoferax soli]